MKAPDHKLVAKVLDTVRPAESAFRSRWRLSTLRRVDAGLHQALREQIDLYHAALVTGSDADLKIQSEAMVRGWRAACAALESPLQPDDAYLVGFDARTGIRVVIAEQQGAIGRVQCLKGERVLIVTPDEVAALMAASTILAETKVLFPDAEIVGVSA